MAYACSVVLSAQILLNLVQVYDVSCFVYGAAPFDPLRKDSSSHPVTVLLNLVAFVVS